MWQNKQLRVVWIFPLLLMLVCAVMAETQKPNHLPEGTWGGDHIRIEVADNSALIEYDCGNGTIQGPLTVKSDGKFDLRGVHHKERGGPVRADEPPNSHPARYRGWTDGKTMTLTVVLSETSEELGTFKLVRGREGRVVKCK